MNKRIASAALYAIGGGGCLLAAWSLTARIPTVIDLWTAAVLISIVGGSLLGSATRTLVKGKADHPALPMSYGEAIRSEAGQKTLQAVIADLHHMSANLRATGEHYLAGHVDLMADHFYTMLSRHHVGSDTICQWCGATFPRNEPRPSCNECETCFCSETCRTTFHNRLQIVHDFDKALEDG